MLRILWEKGEARAVAIYERFNELNEPEISYTAIVASLQRLEAKGMVSRARIGSSNIYVATMPIAFARQLMMWHVVENYFDGDIMNLRRWVAQELDLVRKAKARRDALIAERLKAARESGF